MHAFVLTGKPASYFNYVSWSVSAEVGILNSVMDPEFVFSYVGIKILIWY